MEELDLKIFLEQFSGRTVDFFRFRGNYGDSLIWHGTKILFSKLDISMVDVDLDSAVYNEILIIDGGGNFVDYYADVRDFVVAKHQLYQQVIFLPHTITGEKQIPVLRSLSVATTIFCRERESAAFVSKHAKQCAVYTWHDCAFYNLFSEYQKDGQGILNAFRKDKESTQLQLPEDNIDISYNGYATKPLEQFLEKISTHEQINTDRLHVGIAAAMLGKKVNLYPNSYYKNKAVYDYSLFQFPEVHFIPTNL